MRLVVLADTQGGLPHRFLPRIKPAMEGSSRLRFFEVRHLRISFKVSAMAAAGQTTHSCAKSNLSFCFS
nr:hypothetical protein [Paracoccus saliphilus]